MGPSPSVGAALFLSDHIGLCPDALFDRGFCVLAGVIHGAYLVFVARSPQKTVSRFDYNFVTIEQGEM
jgi:hypothetical protein